MRLPREILSYEDIRARGEQFLVSHGRDKHFPIDIDRIVEFDLGIELVPTPYLQEKCGVDAFIVPDCTAIYIDLNQYIPSSNRGRFSLAHKAAHAILHKEALSKIRSQWQPRDYDTYFRIQSEIHEEDRGWIEWQAFALAGVLLVPSAQLRQRVQIEQQKYAKSAYPPELVRELVRSDVAEYFFVSKEVIDRRCEYEKLVI